VAVTLRLDWANITPNQIEAECGVPVSASFSRITSPATPLVNHTRTGQITCKQGYSPLGFNESCEHLQPTGDVQKQDAAFYYAWAVRVPSGWVSPRGWGYAIQFYSIVTANSGGPACGIQLRGTGTNGLLASFHSGGSPSSAHGLVAPNFGMTLTADVWNCFIFYIVHSGYATGTYSPGGLNNPPSGQAVGQFKAWRMLPELGETDFTQVLNLTNIPTLQRPVGLPCLGGPAVNGSCPVYHTKQGLYRQSQCKTQYEATGSGGTTQIGGLVCANIANPATRCFYGSWTTQADSVVYQGGLVRCDTFTEARAEFGLGVAPPPSGDADIDAALPSLTPGDLRFGNTTIYGTQGSLSADRKRLTKVTVTEETDIHTIRYYVNSVVTGTENLTLICHDDDGANGEPSTRKIESTEKTLACPFTSGWLERIISPAVRLTAGDYWVGSHSDVGLLVTQNQETVAAGARFATDTYPGASNPAGAMTSGDFRFSIVMEGTPTGGGGTPLPGDNEDPVFDQAQTNSSGSFVTLAYDEPLDETSTPATTDFVLTVDGIPRTVTSVSVGGSSVVLSCAVPIAAATTVVVSYTAGSNKIKDVAGNEAANLTDEDVTNVAAAPVGTRFPDVAARTTAALDRVFSADKRLDLGGGGI
jgi:uncharacterized repeat protein (TIGR02059 family)